MVPSCFLQLQGSAECFVLAAYSTSSGQMMLPRPCYKCGPETDYFLLIVAIKVWGWGAWVHSPTVCGTRSAGSWWSFTWMLWGLYNCGLWLGVARPLGALLPTVKRCVRDLGERRRRRWVAVVLQVDEFKYTLYQFIFIFGQRNISWRLFSCQTHLML